MPKSQPYRQRVEDVSHPPSPIHFRSTLQELNRIGRHLSLKKVGRMQLRQQLDEFVLAWRLLPETECGFMPELIDGSRSVHTAHDHVACCRQTVRAASRRIVHDIPAAAAISMTADRRVLTQLWPKARDAIPGGTQKWPNTHFPVLKASTSKRRDAAIRRRRASKSTRSSVARLRFWLRLPSPVANVDRVL